MAFAEKPNSDVGSPQTDKIADNPCQPRDQCGFHKHNLQYVSLAEANRPEDADLIEAVASQMESSKVEAGKAVEAVIDAISSGLRQDEKVAISGFGTFTKKHRSARTGINPATKQPIEIAASITCSFKPSQALKTSL